MKRKPLNKSRLTYLKQNTPLNVVPEKKLKKADLASLIENRGKSRFRTKRLRERVETLIRSDLVFKNKTNAKPHPEQLLTKLNYKFKTQVQSRNTTSNLLVLPQARNTLKARYPFHLNIHAKRTMGSLTKLNYKSNYKFKTKESSSSTSAAILKQQASCVSSKAHQQKETVEKQKIGTKYIAKRRFLGSTRMFSNTRFKVHSQDLKQLVEGRGRKVSPYKARLLERKKLSLIYGNLGWRELRKCVVQSKHKKGVPSPKSGNKKTRPQTSSLPENLITLLESRLDVVLYRCRFFPSFSSCKQAINHGKISVNHRQVRIAGHLLKAGDLIQVTPQSKLVLPRANLVRAAIGSKTFVVSPDSAGKEQKHVVSKKANYLLSLENEKQKTLLYFQNKIKSRPFSPSLPSTLLTRFDPLQRFPWNTNLKPNRLNNTSLLCANSVDRDRAKHHGQVNNKQDYGSCFLPQTVPASKPLRATLKRTKTPLLSSVANLVPKQLNLENQANRLFRDLKERKRILRTLSSTFNNRLNGGGTHVMVRTDRLIKPLRNRDNPSLFLRPQSKSGVTPLAFSNNELLTGTKSEKRKEHNTLSWPRATTGSRVFMPTASKSEPVLLSSVAKQFAKQRAGLRKLSPPFYRALKPLNLEISYQTLTAVFLFPPQKVYFPAHIDLEMIGKSI